METETKFEIFREQVGHLHFVLLRGARMFDLLLQVRLLLITRVSYLSLSCFARVAVVFLVESYKTVIRKDVLMFLSSISSSFLTFRFDHSDAANLRTL